MAKPPPRKPAKPVPGVERGDHVYVQHPVQGAMAVQVLAAGRDGMTGKCDAGKRHQLPWDSYLGHKKRMLQRYALVDQGADGALLEDDDGRRRFLAGEVPVAAGAPAPEPAPAKADDPLMGGMDRLTKAKEPAMTSTGPILFLKAAGAVANRPGLALKRVTDRAGHSTQRWTKTAVDQPAAPKGAARPAGSIGRLHGPAHDNNSPENRAKAADFNAKQTAAGQPTMDDAPDFEGRDKMRAAGQDPDAPAPMKHGDQVTFRHGDVQGSGKIVASGADGVTVHDGEREHQVRHDAIEGPAAAPGGAPDEAKVSDSAQAAPKNPPPLFDHAEVSSLPPKAKQPFADKDALYKASGEALDHLKDWLNRGKGVCDQMGFQTMSGGMESVDWTKPGGMLFIAPLKGEKRAGEKVEADYGGDWSQLKDTVRCSLAVDTMDDLVGALDQLKKSGLVLAQQPKDRFAKPLPEGYRDLMLSVKFPNGLIGEVQVHLKQMLEAKEQGHKPYEVMRKIDAKPRAEWSEEDGQAWQAAFDQSSQIYGSAWAKAGAAKGAPSGAGAGAPAEGQPMAKAMGAGEAAAWEHFDREGAIFRRPKGGPGGAQDVLHGNSWTDYKGDRTAAYLQGDACEDPLAGHGGGGGGGEPMAKSILFLKAAIRGGAMGDLFSAPVQVAGHTTAAGTYVAPYTATRMKAPDVAPAASQIRAAPTLTPAQMASLERLKNYPTRHEAVLSKPDGSQVLLAYTPRKSIRGLLDAAQDRGKDVVAHLALADDARMEAAKGKQELHFSDGSRIHFSGRTQRDAIMEGSLAYIGDVGASPAAAPPAAPVAIPAAPVQPMQAQDLGMPRGGAKPIPDEVLAGDVPLPPGSVLRTEGGFFRVVVPGKPDLPAATNRTDAIRAAVAAYRVELPTPKDWRDETDWHARTQGRMRTLSDESLRYIQKDAGEAAQAMDGIGSTKAGQYQDEAGYARAELASRARTKP